MIPEDKVDDGETLYRCVQFGRGYYTIDEDGSITIDSEAFADPEHMPSVDRAVRRAWKPEQTQIEKSDAILWLATSEVRSLSLDRRDTKPPTPVAVDVRPEPIKDDPEGLPDNDAHAKIVTHPPCTGKVFKRLKQALAQIAEDQWAILPMEVREILTG